MLAIIFRKMPQYNIRNVQAIIINYITCFTLGSILLGGIPINANTTDQSWFPFALFLSVIFITFFNMNALTTQKVGMVITSIFQKLSLIFPVIIGIFFFDELGNWNKYLAIFLAILAIILSNIPQENASKELSKIKKYWYLPLLVFIGSGIVEVTLFYAQEKEYIGPASLDFTSVLFSLAACWGFVFLALRKDLNFRKQEILGGILLGIPNFFTIYLLVKGLELGWEGSILFPLNNVGTIFFTAVVGLIIFKEQFSKLNYLGLLFAIASVVLISL